MSNAREITNEKVKNEGAEEEQHEVKLGGKWGQV